MEDFFLFTFIHVFLFSSILGLVRGKTGTIFAHKVPDGSLIASSQWLTLRHMGLVWLHVARWTQGYGNLLTFATVRGASHEVPFSQPGRSLILFKSFLEGKPLPNSWVVLFIRPEWSMLYLTRKVYLQVLNSYLPLNERYVNLRRYDLFLARIE